MEMLWEGVITLNQDTDVVSFERALEWQSFLAGVLRAPGSTPPFVCPSTQSHRANS